MADAAIPDLLQKIKAAGIDGVTSVTSKITTEQKQILLAHLKGAVITIKPKKISLKKTTTSSIKTSKGVKVAVTVKKRRVYIEKKPDPKLESVEIEKKIEEQTADKTVVAKVVTEEKTVKIEAKKIATKKPKPVAATTSFVKSTTKAKEKDKAKKSAPRDKAGITSNKTAKRIHVSDLDSDYELASASKIRRTPGHKKHGIAANVHGFAKPVKPMVYDVAIPETITVAELAKKMSSKSGALIKVLMQMGTMASINQTLDQETAILAVEEMGHNAHPIKDISIQESLDIQDVTEKISRAPIVTVMGHVDHGKTSLLDYIRKTKVASGEAGGITQHIGAYKVATSKGEITFLDTPGHEAFTAMRVRGAKCTDIIILVVAADDGVMPQTVEAIGHAKAAGVPIIVAINKIDKPEADLERIKTEVSQHDLIPEDWGGDVMFMPVSALEGTGVEELLDAVSLQAEMLELTASATGPARGVVLEARLDKGRGSVASILVTSGVLQRGDIVLAGLEYGKTRALLDQSGAKVNSVGPATPVEMLGLSGVPDAGDEVLILSDERSAREIADKRREQHKAKKLMRQQASKLEGFLNRVKIDPDKIKDAADADTPVIEVKELRILLKTDVHGSLDALSVALTKLTNEEVKVVIVYEGVGGINTSDINLSMASGAIIIGFNVRADSAARNLAKREAITLNYHSIIYDVIDNVQSAVSGLEAPKYQETILGIAEVRDVFRSAKLGAVAGCMVVDGVVKRGSPIRILRNNIVIYEGELESLRRFKDDASEVRNGMECGIGVKNYNDIKSGDQIESYEKTLLK
ncbi:MAG: translation initiation factor IF-2 [Legionellales bacterium]|nr:MAG: translation initiation factor IF-2 [Legionellales bacterium]